MELSLRLAAAAAMVTAGNRLADIGTDHGYLPVWLVSHDICPSAIAADIRKGPLEHARESVRTAGLEDHIELRLSDGLKEIRPGEADTITITGMGGPLICRILKESDSAARAARELVLSPQSNLEEFREDLLGNGYAILDETMVFEDGKYYVIVKAVPRDKKRGESVDSVPWSRTELRYGRILLRKREAVFLSFLQWKRNELTNILAALEKQQTERATARAQQVRTELEELEKILGNKEAQREGHDGINTKSKRHY